MARVNPNERSLWTLDHAIAVREFRDKLEELTTIAVCGRTIVSVERLLKWLRSEISPGRYQTSRLLAAAYSDVEPAFLPISREQLFDQSDSCLLILCILLEIGHGNLVDQFAIRETTDRHLPIRPSQLEDIFGEIGSINKIPDTVALAFNKSQWKFCAARFDLDMSRIYSQDRVLPIYRKERINDKGGTADLWQIEVPEEYVNQSLREVMKGQSYDHLEGRGRCYVFALKTFREGFEDLYTSEKIAFKALRRNEGMVRYLGDFIHTDTRLSSVTTFNVSQAIRPDLQEERAQHGNRKTFNIILAFGEYDLEEYMMETPPPVVQIEVEAFYEKLFRIASAIEGIHNLQLSTDGYVQDYVGWHADLKPDNILFIQGEFKLADPGFAKFVKKTHENPSARLFGGTETYVTTWVVLGYDGIRQYRKLRERAIDKLALVEPPHGIGSSLVVDRIGRGDYFHDGNLVLDVVLSWHEMLRRTLRQSDTVTAGLLDLIDSKTLVHDGKSRLSAKEMVESLDGILAKSKNGPRSYVPASIMTFIQAVDDDLDGRTRETAPVQSQQSQKKLGSTEVQAQVAHTSNRGK